MNIKDIKDRYLKKGKHNSKKIIIAILFSILVATILVIINPTKIWDRIPIFSVLICFIMIHFIYKIRDIYEFVYKKRYWLALIFMIYVIIMGYSGSSIGTYTNVIQGEQQERYYTPILGSYRSIRSDEWCVNTPLYTSQALDKDTTYAYFNDNLRGRMTDMSSIANSPVIDITTIGKPFNIAYMLLGPERGLSFIWYGKIVALILVSFEFCMLLTKKKKFISLCGMLLLTFSAAIQWWNSTELLMWGMLALLLIDKFMTTKKWKTKLWCTLGVFISGISYIFIFYPAWQLTYGYIYLAIFIWICIKNRKEYKINIKDVLLIVLVIIAMAGLLGRYFIKSQETLDIVMNTDYPGERFEMGGNEESNKVVYSYVYSYLFPYVEMNNPCELAGMISFYPIPIILAVLYMIRNRKDKQSWKFLIPMLVISLLLSVWTFCTTNEFFAKITFLYMAPPTRTAIPLGVTQILLLIYLLGTVKKEDIIIKNKIIRTSIAIVSTIIVVMLARKTDIYQIMEGATLYICGLITLFGIYNMLNINKEKNKQYLIGFLILMSIITGVAVNPIQKGISVLTEKPIAQKIQEIVKEDKDNNRWIVDSTTFYVPNYVLANGAKVINSTNIYPNFDLYKTVLEEEADKEEIRKIYNRYAHISMEISQENKLELLYEDSIKLYVTTEKLKQLGVKYIVTTRNLKNFETEDVVYEEIYNEYGMQIYKLAY